MDTKNLGKFKTYPHDVRYEVSDQGWVRNVKTNRKSKGHRKHDGYMYYLVGGKGGVCRPVHNMVLETFVGDCPEGCQCHHINSNTSDNRLVNLKWVTVKEHAKDYHHKKERGKAVAIFFTSGLYRNAFKGSYVTTTDAAKAINTTRKTLVKAINGLTVIPGYRIQFI